MYLKCKVEHEGIHKIYKVTDYGLVATGTLFKYNWSWDVLINELKWLRKPSKLALSHWGDCEVLTDDEYFLELI